MKNKGFILFITILLAIVCFYQLSFTVVTRNIEKKINKKAEKTGESIKTVTENFRNKKVWLGYTYQECKEREINLGLDLQGGMNVTIEVSIPGMIDKLSGEDQDPNFRKAMDQAKATFLGQQNFVDLFQSIYDPLNPKKDGLARIFYQNSSKNELPNEYSSTNDEIYTWLKTRSEAIVEQTLNVIRTRIDEFNVAQPNIQLLDNSRILVELPGVDNPDRIRRILVSSAKLEFWLPFPKQDAALALEQIDKIVAAELKDAGNSTDTNSDIKAPEGLGIDSNKVETLDLDSGAIAQTKQILDSNGNVVEDTTLDANEKANEPQLTREEALLKFPISARLQFNTQKLENGQQVWAQSGALAYVNTKDKAFIQKYLDSARKHDLLMSRLQFRWDFKAFTNKDGQSFVALYALQSKDGENTPVLTGDVITNSRTVLDPSGSYSVSMVMNSEGSSEWAIITENAAANNEFVAILLDDKVYSAPSVNEKITGGNSSISGRFTRDEADDLSNILKSGKLDAKPIIVEESVVGPSLGEASINAGLMSLAFGFIAVIIFMFLYYGKAGAYAVVALLANLFFILGVLAGQGAALTLPGMAGLVLTIGMAVDANVLIFERIKEELATGKGFKASIQSGYKAAYSSIVDANITTLIAAVILFNLGKGPVAGFAIILLIGILCSLFTAIFLTRMFIEKDITKGVETTFTTGMSKKALGHKFHYDFIGKRKKFYIISGIIIALGVGSLFTNGVSTGIDFKGGWSYLVELDSDQSIDNIKSAIGKNLPDNENVEVKTYGSKGSVGKGYAYKITTAYRIKDNSPDVGNEVKDLVKSSLATLGTVEMVSQSKVGPTIAEDIKSNSLKAIILSLIGMFIYIVFRFRKWFFGLGATVALFHDVLIVFSLYSILYKIMPFTMDIDQAFIAAILTVVGYSINDTVVVFDRVREFLGLHKYAENTDGIINDAINQTLGRTIVTSLTTLIVILILFLFGGDGLKGFTFALLIGVAVGTYSSICIATPIVVDFMGDSLSKDVKKKRSLKK